MVFIRRGVFACFCFITVLIYNSMIPVLARPNPQNIQVKSDKKHSPTKVPLKSSANLTHSSKRTTGSQSSTDTRSDSSTAMANDGQSPWWVSAMGAVAAAVAAIYTGVQVRMAKAQMKIIVYANITDRVFSVNQLFITHPEFRPYFYNRIHVNKEKIGEEKYSQLIAVAEFVLDFCSSLLEHRDLLEEKYLFKVSKTKISWGEWEKYIEDIMGSSPILCKLLLEKRKWYEETLWDLSPLNEEHIRKRLTNASTKQAIILNNNDIDQLLKDIFISES